MDDSVRKGIASAWTAAEKPMSFPYHDTRAFAGLSCDGEGAYFRFTNVPNLDGDETHSGYNSIELRVRFDKYSPVREIFFQNWGSDQLNTRSRVIREAILRYRTMLLEVPWHRSGRVYFRFDLTGSSDAYKMQCAERIRSDAERARAQEKANAERERAQEKANAERARRQARAAEQARAQADLRAAFDELYPTGSASAALLRDVEAATGPCRYIVYVATSLKPLGIVIGCPRGGKRLWTPSGIISIEDHSSDHQDRESEIRQED